MNRNRTIRILAAPGLIVLLAGVGTVGYGVWRLYQGYSWVKKQNAKAEKLTAFEDVIGDNIAPEKNAARVYKRAFEAWELTDADTEALRGQEVGDHPRRKTYNISKLRTILADNERALQLLKRAVEMKQCRFDIDYTDPMRAVFYHLGPMRTAARLQLAKARVLAEDGRCRHSLNSCILPYDMAADTTTGAPVAVTYLVQISVQELALRTIHSLVRDRAFSAETFLALRRRLTQKKTGGTCLKILNGERALQLLMLDRLPDVFQKRDRPSDSAVPQSRLPFIGIRWSNRAYTVHFMNRYIELARRPYRHSRQQFEQLAHEINQLPFYAAFARAMLPEFSEITAKRDKLRARIMLCIVALDLKAYKQRHGQYPDSMDSLPMVGREGYGMDIFTGRPLRYEKRSDGFILYSFGKDLDDDGGRPRGTVIDGAPRWNDCDLVWCCGG